MRRHYIAAGACIALLAVSLLGSVQAHAKPGKGKGRAEAVAAVTVEVNAEASDLRYFGHVAYTTTGETPEPLYVRTFCYQGEKWVWQYVAPATDVQPLEGEGIASGWDGGAASCVAEAFYYIGVVDGVPSDWSGILASTTFEVSDGSG